MPDERHSPEADAENKANCDIRKGAASAQPEMVADVPDNYWNHGPAHDGGAQNTGERTVVLSDRIERQRNNNWPHHRSEQADRGESDHRHICRSKQSHGETEGRADTRPDQYLAVIKFF